VKKRQRKKPARKRKPKRLDIQLEDLKSIVERSASGPLGTEDREVLGGAVDTLAYLTNEIQMKGASIRRLRKLIFGSSTEKTSQVVGSTDDEDDAPTDGAGSDGSDDGQGSTEPKKKRKGHGRNGADAYHGADKVKIPYGALKKSDRCPDCRRGRVYPLPDPAVMVRVKGMAPLLATVYELERLRCNLCGQVFTARAPEGVGDKKYDETAAAMIAMLKYGCGFPFNRLERLEGSLGIPLPASTQWEVVEPAAGLLEPAYEEMVRQGAQGEVIHNDDTTMKILELMKQSRQEAMSESGSKERTGVYTSGIVSVAGGHRIALFFTGRKHAGENLEDVLAKRAEELSMPIQMSDMLSHNTAGEFETILAGCISHARRRFVDVAENFPVEVRHVLEELRKVYVNDAETKKQEMSPEERLRYHQEHSEPVMTALKKWLREQIKEKKVEPNSGLGEAIAFMRKHWDKLTLFLHKPGAPLDNNICERALKKAILHRKASLFYKTQNGARVGDMYMTLIHTCELNDINPFDYLVVLQRHHEDVARNPGDWMPWNYQSTLENLGGET